MQAAKAAVEAAHDAEKDDVLEKAEAKKNRAVHKIHKANRGVEMHGPATPFPFHMPHVVVILCAGILIGGLFVLFVNKYHGDKQNPSDAVV